MVPAAPVLARPSRAHSWHKQHASTDLRFVSTQMRPVTRVPLHITDACAMTENDDVSEAEDITHDGKSPLAKGMNGNESDSDSDDASDDEYAHLARFALRER